MKSRAAKRPAGVASPTSVAQLQADPKNARKHGDRNIGAIVSGLEEVGAARSIVIDEDSVILAGNATVDAARKDGITKLRVIDVDGQTLVAVRRLGLTPEQKTRLAIIDNRAAELAEGWDTDVLRGLQGSGGLDGLWTDDELAKLFTASDAAEQGLTDPDVVPEVRETSIVAGDLFELGQHRLLCGDSTDAAVVGRVLGDVRPTLMVTDPPYGVQYDPTWRAKAGINKNPKKMGLVENDDRCDWTPVWQSFPGDVAYIWHAALKGGVVQASIEAAGLELRSQIIWVKDRLVLSRADYHWQHETCWYAVRVDKKGHRTSDRKPSTVWRIPTPINLQDAAPEVSTVWEIPSRDDAGHSHGTQKPVECMARPIRNHHAPDVFDPFCGSGSTIIAAEMYGRRCFAIELMPSYVQVAIDRWEAFTGKKAVKVA